MKLVIQRCQEASVSVDGKTVGAIEKGLMVLIGVGKDDTTEVVDKYLKKLLVPLGLYTPIDIRLKPSLENLTKYRGGYAHSSHRNIRSLSPEDSRTYVRDVYEIMVELAKKSSNIFYYSIH